MTFIHIMKPGYAISEEVYVFEASMGKEVNGNVFPQDPTYDPSEYLWGAWPWIDDEPPESNEEAPTIENTIPPPTDLPDGFHTYICDDYWTYEGYWENGLPNGAGTMTGKDAEQTEIYEANFVDGMMHGTVVYTVIFDNQTMKWTFEVNMGYSAEEIVTNSKGEELTAYTTFFGVPPWAHYWLGDR
jgi:hypothetical protein